MRLALILMVILLVVSTTLQAQPFVSGTLTCAGGKKIQCQLTPPEDYQTKEIRYRLNDRSPVVVVPSDSLTYISVAIGEGNTIDFEWLATTWDLDKKPSKKAWLLVVVSGYATLYMKSEYDIDYRDGVSVTAWYTIGRSLPYFDFFLKKRGMEVAVFFSKTSNSAGYLGLHTTLKKSVHSYLADYPELVAQVDDKTYTHYDSDKIIRLYNQFKEIR
jgi:hypothetical protein